MQSEFVSTPTCALKLAPMAQIRLCACALAMLFTLGLAAAAAAQARTLAVLHTFAGGADGTHPFAGSLIKDANGNLYGVAPGGGDLTCGNGRGCGVVFKVDPTGKETVLYTFTGGADGSGPVGALLRDAAGSLFGTTTSGGTGGSGTVFRLSAKGKKTVLYNFLGSEGSDADGDEPFGGLIRDAAGNLYGTTLHGGIDPLGICNLDGCGIVFKVDTAGKETILYRFRGSVDGGASTAGVIRDAAGNLYGTTQLGGDLTCGGGYGCGVVFKLDATGQETALYTFEGGADGLQPAGGLAWGAAGNLYGTAGLGGDLSCAEGDGFGCGTVFKVDNAGNETTLHSFAGGKDGFGPSGSLIVDAAGHVWGALSDGGTFNSGYVFRLDPNGKKIVLHSFTGGSDGAVPYAGVIRDAAGNLYGTTHDGGDLTCPQGNGFGCGTVYKIAAVAP